MKSSRGEYGPLPEWESLFLFCLCTKDDNYITLDYENSRQGIPPMKYHSDTLWSEEEQYTYFSIFPESSLQFTAKCCFPIYIYIIFIFFDITISWKQDKLTFESKLCEDDNTFRKMYLEIVRIMFSHHDKTVWFYDFMSIVQINCLIQCKNVIYNIFSYVKKNFYHNIVTFSPINM